MDSSWTFVSSFASVVSSGCCSSSMSILTNTSYNSAVFSSIAVNNYFAMSVSESFVTDDECYNCGNITRPWSEEPVRTMWQKAHNNELERLSNVDCIQAYAEMLQTKRRNVLLVASDDKLPPANESIIGRSHVYAMNAVSASTAATSQDAAHIYGKSGWTMTIDPD